MRITTEDLTEVEVTGSGVFDHLMRAARAHLDEEYSKNRIRGPEYSEVYLGAMQAVLAQSIQFLLERDRAAAQAALIQEQIITEQKQQALLEAQIVVLGGEKCKLDAEYDVLVETRLKTVAETALLNQKMATEKAQTVGAGVDDDSYIGKQKLLYEAQAEGFVRDAEQKAAKLMADTWNVRRTTDEGVQANVTNRLDDASVGRAINRLLSGINA